MLKSCKGITLTSLVIYVIVLMIVIALMSGFSGYFNKNINQITIKEENNEQFTRFLAYLTKDINNENIKFAKTGQENDIEYIIIKFEENEEHQYLYKKDSIYYINEAKNKKIRICNNVNSCDFEYDNTNKILTVNIVINNEEYSKSLNVNIN